MLKLFLTKKLEMVEYFVIFDLSAGTKSKRLFQNVSLDNLGDIYTVVDNPKDADFIAVPYNYFSVKNIAGYINECVAVAQSVQKKILIFAYGDSDEEINIPNSIIFRMSQYAGKKRGNEIIMPAYVEDLGSDDFARRLKKDSKPVVSFVGWAGLKNFSQRFKYFYKIITKINLHRQGLYFRRKTLWILDKSNLVDTAFVIRSSYSGHKNTIELSPEEARREFIEKINNSDFSLAVKGDGNYSLRFYEILSLGRIPVLVDTDCPLPFEDKIKYDDFILRVDYKKIDKIDQIISDYYKKLDNDQFVEMQKKARGAFSKYLNIRSFFMIAFKELEESKHEK